MPPEKPEHDYYEILQVHPRASLAVIKKAYRTLLLEMGHHPDQGGAADTAALITQAYGVLSDPNKRARYDRHYMGYKTAQLEREKAAHYEKSGTEFAGGLIVLCPRCGVKNRVRSQELLEVAKCSRCGQFLNRLPSPFAALKESILSLFRPKAPAKGTSKFLTFGVPSLLLMATAGAGYVYMTGGWGPDPLDATEKLRLEGRLGEATDLMEQAVEREPANPRWHEKLGDLYTKQNLFEEALKAYEQSIKLSPQNSFLYTLQGNSYLSLNRLAEAELSYKQALRLDPQQSAALLAMGNILARRQNFKDAALYYQQARQVQPTADIFYNLGMVYQWDNRPAQAIQAFNQALMLDPNHRATMVSLASLYYSQRKYDLAASELVKAGQLQHHDLDLHLRLADIYERVGRKREAIHEWQVCLSQGKGNPAIQERAQKAISRLNGES